MLYQALQAHLKSGKLSACYVVKGNDPYLKGKAIEAISAVAEMPMFNLNVFETADDEGAVTGALRILPMGSEYRVVVVGELVGDAAKSGGKRIIEYLKDPEPSSVLVINDRSGKAYDGIAKHAQTVECDRLSAVELRTVVMERAGDIESSAAAAVVEYCGADMGRIIGECAKLRDYAGSARITMDMVTALVHRDVEYKIFEFTGALSDKKVSRAYEIWGEMRRSDPGGMIAALLGHFRRLLYVAVSAADDSVIAASLGVRVEALRHYRRAVSNFSPVKLKKIVDYLHTRDYLIKNGEVSMDAAINNTLLRILNI